MDPEGIDPMAFERAADWVRVGRNLVHAGQFLGAEDLSSAFAAVPAHTEDRQRVGRVLSIDEQIDVPAHRNAGQGRITLDFPINRRVSELPGCRTSCASVGSYLPQRVSRPCRSRQYENYQIISRRLVSPPIRLTRGYSSSKTATKLGQSEKYQY